ncbi:MAG: fatty acid desaturase, partial [Bacteroidia bacterium]|nr:fatty acid desaturase [Bacteroidia bacterium]
MRELPTITDPTFTEVKSYSSFDRFLLKYINDERDLPFVHLIIKLTCINLPVALLLFTPLLTGWVWWAVGLFYGGLVIYYVGPFTLMLHNTSHRRLFKQKYKIMNHYIPWVIGPFLGQSPETYFSHHIGMHHAENNMEGDKSSTMSYQRDSFIDFVKYGGGFLLIGVWELAEYFRKKKFMKLYKMVMRGEFSFIFLIIILGYFHLQAALWVFITCTIIVRLSMMAGNWGQHAFIDANTPDN